MVVSALVVIDGDAITDTVVWAVSLQPPLPTVTVYVPDCDTNAEEMIGFCDPEVKPAGPVQLYVVPPDELKLMGCPEQTLDVEDALALGVGRISMVVVDELAQGPGVV